MSKVIDVAVREFRHTVMTKAFLLAAIVLPAMVTGLVFILPGLLTAPPKPLEGRLAVIDPEARAVDSVRTEFDADRLAAEREAKRAQYEAILAETVPEAFRSSVMKRLEQLDEDPLPAVTVEHSGDPQALDDLKVEVRAGEYLGVAVLTAAVLEAEPGSNQFELFIAPDLTRKHAEALKDSISRGVVRARSFEAGLDLKKTQALLDRPTALTTTLTEAGGEARDNEVARIFVPFAFMMLLWMSTMMTGNYLLTTTIEEKSNKVIEVLLSAVSPMQLMTGKIAGQCLVGILILAMYGTLGVVTARHFDASHLVPAEKLGYLLVYFLMAYFMVGATMAAIGSAVNELREAQAFVGPATMIFMIPFFAWFFISDNPNSTFATVLSFIPPITPFAMILRVTSAETVPMWQVIATTVVGYAGVVAMIWMAARIFRVGVLMYGKPPTPQELLKWVRYR